MYEYLRKNLYFQYHLYSNRPKNKFHSINSISKIRQSKKQKKKKRNTFSKVS